MSGPGIRPGPWIVDGSSLLAALEKINEWCCHASDKDASTRLLALQQIGLHARAAIAKAKGEPK